MAASYPNIRTDKYHIDILTAHFVQHRTGSMSWWPPICLAIFSRPGARVYRYHRHRTLGKFEPGKGFPSLFDRFMVRHQTSSARESPIRSGRYGRLMMLEHLAIGMRQRPSCTPSKPYSQKALAHLIWAAKRIQPMSEKAVASVIECA